MLKAFKRIDITNPTAMRNASRSVDLPPEMRNITGWTHSSTSARAQYVISVDNYVCYVISSDNYAMHVACTYDNDFANWTLFDFASSQRGPDI